ncbi:MAG: putative ribosomal protein N-acetyltransferase [Myxococcales bacterium]|nr:putative ribosomal protein N-acetyltransferase [Myxococcales bacterium]
MEKRPLPERIEGGRVVLKKHALEEAERMFANVDRDRQRLRQFLPWVDSVKSVDDERAYIESTIDKWAGFDYFDFGIFRVGDAVYLGNAGVHSIAWSDDRCEIGYWLLGDFERQGFMSETVALLERACFAIGFHRVEIRCSSLNLRSANLPRRNGYHLDGLLRQDAVENGGYRDTLVFSKLRSDG